MTGEGRTMFFRSRVLRCVYVCVCVDRDPMPRVGTKARVQKTSSSEAPHEAKVVSKCWYILGTYDHKAPLVKVVRVVCKHKEAQNLTKEQYFLKQQVRRISSRGFLLLQSTEKSPQWGKKKKNAQCDFKHPSSFLYLLCLQHLDNLPRSTNSRMRHLATTSLLICLLCIFFCWLY